MAAGVSASTAIRFEPHRVVVPVFGGAIVLLPWPILRGVPIVVPAAAIVAIGLAAAWHPGDAWRGRCIVLVAYTLLVPFFGPIASEAAAHLLLGLCLQ